MSTAEARFRVYDEAARRLLGPPGWDDRMSAAEAARALRHAGHRVRVYDTETESWADAPEEKR